MDWDFITHTYLPKTQLRAQLLTTSQKRSRVEYLMPTYNIRVPLLHLIFSKRI